MENISGSFQALDLLRVTYPMETSMHSTNLTPTDFDFEIGSWRVKHRRLRQRLVASSDWEEFDGTSSMRTVLGGNGNIEDNLLHLGSGTYRAIAIRSFDPIKKSWAIWWLDERDPHILDTPVVGSFKNSIGTFYADLILNDVPTRLRFLWLHKDRASPRWEQAMSIDRGNTWETNWTMDFFRA